LAQLPFSAILAQVSPKEGIMLSPRTALRSMTVLAALVFVFAAGSASADIFDDWDTAKVPGKIELKPVTLDPKTTAMLILDLTKNGSCSTRPRCLASVPSVKRIHDAARAAGLMFWYSAGTKDMIDPGITPKEGEYVNRNGPDKFFESNLQEKLKAGDIQTVIICGTSFQGVGIGTGTDAAQLGYKVIIPIDCLSSEDPYMEQYSAWHFFKGGPNAVVRASTVTRTSMITFAANPK
jgi:Isochorismatase family